LSVFKLPVTENTLRRKVDEFRKMIDRRDGTTRQALTARARELYDLLIRPAEALLGENQRILIVPDGPLHVLPFAALMRSENEYLIEWKPIHTAVSVTVYAGLKKMRRELRSAAVDVAAFGDPRYPTDDRTKQPRIDDAELRSAVERGLTFARLPFTREEVESITALYPNHSEKYLGAEATESHAKSLGTKVRYIHFATHAVLDAQFPLNSAVVLTIPEKVVEGHENGLLQAWEIFDQMRLDADLVTLSACSTGLGKEIKGEGLIGLTRAFQYAGARSVLASLWALNDFRAADFMKQFYGQLKQGKTKDEALRVAQLYMLRSRASSHPYYWAAFTLSGDWR
jgi:CHAT domain-containing protein